MENAKSEQRSRRLEHLRTILLAVLLALTIRTGLAQAYLVEGPSMEPTLESGQRVLVVKYPYGLTLPSADEALVVWAEPQRGDVVILSSPIDGIDLVKRVVGLPGDIVEVRDGRVIINNTSLATGESGPCPTPPGEDGCLWEGEASGGAHWTTRRSPYAVPDSQPAQIIPEGQIFVLGDHRDRSNDSRYFGTVSTSRLRGRVAFLD